MMSLTSFSSIFHASLASLSFLRQYLEAKGCRDYGYRAVDLSGRSLLCFVWFGTRFNLIEKRPDAKKGPLKSDCLHVCMSIASGVCEAPSDMFSECLNRVDSFLVEHNVETQPNFAVRIFVQMLRISNYNQHYRVKACTCIAVLYDYPSENELK